MIFDRKNSHLFICKKYDVSFRKSTHFDDVELVHCALPELNLEEIDTSISFLGKKISAPIIISAMTGGTPEAKKINENLAKAASKIGIGMCVGSQRIAIENPQFQDTFTIVREVASDLVVIANIGGAQLLQKNFIEYAEKAISMLNADALAIHLNPLQELVQPGGDTRFKGILDAIRDLSKHIKVPIIVKEVGCGISKEVAEKIIDTGIYAIDIAGAGGTSWAAVEYYHALQTGDLSKSKIAETLWDWGIPTAMSICEVVSLNPKITIIASGGIRNGLHIAKSIALGADLVGIARPLLLCAISSSEMVIEYLQNLINELKIILLLTGCKNIKQLKSVPIVIKGELLNWIIQRNLKVRGIDRGKT
ncbi:MAG: type 2 isopentenyl-diphosphate Delta-isomerase [Candidatus Verstraetearchaeota archaeon]|nr:type 2 isopentenyl-diphosphate Delta-isomerase [Candidatus Verstraetearchaeota archaeon]